MLQRIILTGGGSAGHVTPNIALIPELRREGWEVHYIGTKDGIERQLIEPLGVPYHVVAAGKLRRYFDLRNFADPFNVLKGLFQAAGLIRRIKPAVIFAKGGFVSVPVVVGGWLNRAPVIIHESDMSPGLANRISLPFASRICATFPETLKHLPAGKGVLTGSPIRREILNGDKARGLVFCGFNASRPVILVIGGSLGAASINRQVRAVLTGLLAGFQVAHICGKGNLDPHLGNIPGYRQFEYVGKELPDLFAAADLVISRAGANTIFELLALRKPNLLIPLSKGASRGDQILNAQSFARQGFSKVLLEENMNDTTFLQEVKELFDSRPGYVRAMENSRLKDGVGEVMKLLRAYGEAWDGKKL